MKLDVDINLPSGILPASSLIICSRNRPRLLLETVYSVLQGTQVPGEILIIDQSEIPNLELIDLGGSRECQIRYVHSQSVGLSRARNEGMRAASQEVYIFIDDDMYVAKNWYELLIQALIKAGPQSVVTGRVLPGHSDKSSGFAGTLVERDWPAIYRGRIGTDVLAGCHMAMYRSIYLEVGTFDERLGAGSRFGAEDNDYGFRVLEAGKSIVYEPQAIVYHRAWRDYRDYLPLRWAYGRGKGGFYTKYLSLKDPYMLLRMLQDLSIRFIRFPWRVFHKPRLAIGDLYYAFGMISGSVEWMWTYRFNRASPPDTQS